MSHYIYYKLALRLSGAASVICIYTVQTAKPISAVRKIEFIVFAISIFSAPVKNVCQYFINAMEDVKKLSKSMRIIYYT